MALITELKRRNVFRVAVAYAIVAWLLVEVASVLLPTFEAPAWVMKAFSSLVILGFPIALIFAWAFELTPEGIKRESDVDPDESITHVTGRKLDFAIIGLLLAAVVFLVFEAYILESGPEPVPPPVEPVSVPVEPVLDGEPTAREKSIAVLPFANMSGDPDQEFFSDGISEELLNVLAKVKGLRVTSRTSAFAFKGTNTSIPEIAEKLNVEHVLEGSVRMAGDRVRITTQLIEVETDSHLWSESYDRELNDIFAVQDEIAAKVGEALSVALLSSNSQPIRASRETSIDVYSDYLLARRKLANAGNINRTQAERLLRGVIERDPNYAPAYAALAWTYRVGALGGFFSPSEAATRMIPLIDKALSLDNGLAEVWQLLAFVRRTHDNFEGGRAAEEKALQLNPHNPLVLRNQIVRWIWTHEPERGLAYANELIRVDPLSPWSLFWTIELYERLGRVVDVDSTLARLHAIDPIGNIYLWSTTLVAWSRGDLVTALRSMENDASIDSEDSETFSDLALIYADLGDRATAEFWNDAALRIDPEAPRARTAAAFLHLYRNEEAEAVAMAREPARLGSHNRWDTRGISLRIVAAPDLAAANYQEIIRRYLDHYPDLAEGIFPTRRASTKNSSVWDIFLVTLDLAAVYSKAGEKAKAESLFSLVESELPHWSKTAIWGSGTADVELHALLGEKERALAALRAHAAAGMRYMWRWQLLYNPNLESIRDTPEFAAIVAKIEADMAEQLARVREMQRNGELEPIPELAVE